jgi:autotransporter-associated beta strand protein
LTLAQFTDSQYTNQPSLATINSNVAYALGYSGLGVTVGIVDSGINPNNAAFSGAIVGGYNAFSGLTGVNNLTDYSSQSYHGTFTASEIVARRGNGGYFQGLAYNSNLVAGAGIGGASDAQTAAALNYVSSQGVKVINNSWGYASSYSYATIAAAAPLTITAIKNALANNIAMVFSAGNDGTAQPGPLSLIPYNNPSISGVGGFIVAAASTVDGLYMARASGTGGNGVAYTNYCGVTMSYCITAPGGIIAATYTNGTTLSSANLSGIDSRPVIGINGASNSNTITGTTIDVGTSMAAPFVTGAVALVAEAFPWMNNTQLATSVLTTGSSATTPNAISGRGLLNVGKAVQGPGIFESDFTANTSGNNSTFGNNISGNYGLIKSGLGTLSLTGTNTYLGTTTVSGGVLQLGSGGSIGTFGVGSVIDNSYIYLNRSNNFLISNLISGSGLIKTIGLGGVTLSSTNTFSGGIEVDSGSSLTISNSSQLGTGSLSLVGTPTTTATLNITASTTISNAISVAYDPTFNISSGTTTTVSSVISDGTAPGDLVVNGAGTLQLQGVNTYTGVTTISNGATLALNGAGSIASSNSIANNGTFDIGTTTSGASITSLSGSGVTTLGSKSLTLTNASGTYSGAISGTGGLITSGGSETLTGTNTYTGSTVINSGASIALSGSGSISNSSSVTNSGTFNIAGTSSGVSIKSLNGSGITILGSNTLNLSVASNTYSGVISGTGGLTVSGGTETISGTNVFTGLTTINSGASIALSGSGSIATSSGIANNGTFDISGTTSGASISTMSGSGGTILGTKALTLTNASNTYSGVISGSGGFTVAGGTETLSGTNSYTGVTNINSGAVLALTGNGSISNSSQIIDNGTLDISNTNSGTSIITLSGSGTTILGSKTLTILQAPSSYTGTFSGTGGITVASGTQQITGTNTFTGSTTINNGSAINLVNLGSIANSSSLANNGTFDISSTTSGTSLQSMSGTGSTVLGSKTLTLTNSNDTYSGAISGTGGLTVSGGNQTLTGVNNFSGSTLVSSGATISLSGGGSIANSSSVTNNGTLNIANTTTGASLTTISGSGTTILGNKQLTITNGSSTYSGVLTGTGTFSVNGGSIALSGVNTYSGGTNISTGSTLSITGTGAIASSIGVNNTGIFDISSASSVVSIKDLSGSGSTLLGSNSLNLTGATSTYSGTASGAGGITISSGSSQLAGSNTYTGATTISSGATLALTGNGNIGTSSGLTNNGSLDISTTTSGTSIKSLSGIGTTALGSKTLTLSNASGTYSGVLSGTGGLTITSGTETLSGNNSFSGPTTINSGATLIIGSGNSLGTGSLQLVGSLTTSANINITSSTTITNPITVAFDPTFNISPGTTTTVSSIISDGGAPGDVVVTGGGTLVLQGVNTYTGSTTINAGSSLALSGSGSTSASSGLINNGVLDISATNTGTSIITISGSGTTSLGSKTLSLTNASDTYSGIIAGTGGLTISGGTETLTGTSTYSGLTNVNQGATLLISGNGSIGNSSSVINAGTLNFTGKNTNVSLGGSYTQTNTGNLWLNFSPTNNQTLSIAGAANVNGGLNLIAAAGSYSKGSYLLISSSNFTGNFSNFSTNLGSFTTLGYLLSYDNLNVYLKLIPNLGDTQTSVQQLSNGLQSTYTFQTAAINIGLTYDCNLFDENSICLSTGGRYTRVNTGDNGNNALLIGAYKLNENFRLGAYLDQNLNPSNLASGINLGNSNPLFGIFGVWNERSEQLGYSVRLAAGYGDRDLTTTRQINGTSEAGSGSTRLNAQSALVEGSYTFPVYEQWMATPYLGIRYTKVASSAYNEQGSSTVTTPLYYDALIEETTTTLAGIRVRGILANRIGLFGSIGAEQDINNHGDNYSASGINGLNPITLNPNIQKTRAVATVGSYYEIDKTQRLSFNMIYRQEAFQSTNTLSSLLAYTVGF